MLDWLKRLWYGQDEPLLPISIIDYVSEEGYYEEEE